MKESAQSRPAGWALLLMASALWLAGCQTNRPHARAEVTGVWGQAHGVLGEFDQVTFGPGGEFVWIHEDEPLQTLNTYRGRWAWQTDAIRLTFDSGQTRAGQTIQTLPGQILLQIEKAKGRVFLVSENGMRLEKDQ